MSKLAKISIIISLVLNFVLAGLVIGYITADKKRGWGDKEQLIKQFPPKIQVSFRAISDGKKQLRSERRNIRKQLHEVLTAEQFDKQKFLRLQAKMHQMSHKSWQQIAHKIATLAENMTQEQRQILAKIMRRGGKIKLRRKEGKRQ